MTSNDKLIKVEDRSDLVRLFEMLKYPISKEQLLRKKASDVEISWRKSDPITVKDAIAVLHPHAFNSVEDLVDNLCSALELSYRDYSVENQQAILANDTL